MLIAHAEENIGGTLMSRKDKDTERVASHMTGIPPNPSGQFATGEVVMETLSSEYGTASSVSMQNQSYFVVITVAGCRQHLYRHGGFGL